MKRLIFIIVSTSIIIAITVTGVVFIQDYMDMSRGDVNRDGRVDSLDLSTVLANFSK